MDLNRKRAIGNNIELTLAVAAAKLGCGDPLARVVIHDTAVSELQPLVGDYVAFSLSGVIRIADYEAMQPKTEMVRYGGAPGVPPAILLEPEVQK